MSRTSARSSSFPDFLSTFSSSGWFSKWSSIAPFEALVTKTSFSAPAATASSTAYCTNGLSTIGNISLGEAFEAGKKRLPSPATGKTAARILELKLPTP